MLFDDDVNDVGEDVTEVGVLDGGWEFVDPAVLEYGGHDGVNDIGETSNTFNRL